VYPSDTHTHTSSNNHTILPYTHTDKTEERRCDGEGGEGVVWVSGEEEEEVCDGEAKRTNLAIEHVRGFDVKVRVVVSFESE